MCEIEQCPIGRDDIFLTFIRCSYLHTSDRLNARKDMVIP